jgi:hypothetical protein
MGNSKGSVDGFVWDLTLPIDFKNTFCEIKVEGSLA